VAPNTLGLHDLDKAEKIPIRRTFVHEGYRAGGGVPNHDIVIHLLAETAGTPHVDVASTEDLDGAAKVTLAGFGRDDVHSTSGFGVKREVTVDILAPRPGDGGIAESEDHYGYESDNEFVAGSLVMDSCNGDSGGPAYIEDPRRPGQWRAAGLTSRGIREPDGDDTPCGDGGIYTRIDKHWDWIVSTVSKYLQ
jgi:endonuclease G